MTTDRRGKSRADHDLADDDEHAISLVMEIFLRTTNVLLPKWCVNLGKPFIHTSFSGKLYHDPADRTSRPIDLDARNRIGS